MAETRKASGKRRSARAIVASIALSDLPLPIEIDIREDGKLRLSFASIADALAWCPLLGTVAAPYLNGDGKRYLGADAGTWHGWTVHLWAVEKPGSPDNLDEATTQALAAVAEAVES